MNQGLQQKVVDDARAIKDNLDSLKSDWVKLGFRTSEADGRISQLEDDAGQLSEEHGWQNCSARGSFIVSGKLQYKKQQIEGVWEGTENWLKLMDCVTDFHEYLKQRDHREWVMTCSRLSHDPVLCHSERNNVTTVIAQQSCPINEPRITEVVWCNSSSTDQRNTILRCSTPKLLVHRCLDLQQPTLEKKSHNNTNRLRQWWTSNFSVMQY